VGNESRPSNNLGGGDMSHTMGGCPRYEGWTAHYDADLGGDVHFMHPDIDHLKFRVPAILLVDVVAERVRSVIIGEVESIESMGLLVSQASPSCL